MKVIGFIGGRYEEILAANLAVRDLFTRRGFNLIESKYMPYEVNIPEDSVMQVARIDDAEAVNRILENDGIVFKVGQMNYLYAHLPDFVQNFDGPSISAYSPEDIGFKVYCTLDAMYFGNEPEDRY